MNTPTKEHQIYSIQSEIKYYKHRIEELEKITEPNKAFKRFIVEYKKTINELEMKWLLIK